VPSGPGACAPRGGERASRNVEAKSPKWNDLAEKVREASNLETYSRKLLPLPLKPDAMACARGLSVTGSKERGRRSRRAPLPAIRLADPQMVPQQIELFNGVRPDDPNRDVLAAKGSAKPDAAAIQCRCCSGNGLAQTHFPPAHLSNSGDCCGLNHTCQTAPSEQLTSHSSVPSSPA